MPKIRSAALALLVAAITLAASCGSAPVERADLILTNAAITTMAPGRPRAEALAVAAGKIVYVGDSRKALRRRGPATRAGTR